MIDIYLRYRYNDIVLLRYRKYFFLVGEIFVANKYKKALALFICSTIFLSGCFESSTSSLTESMEEAIKNVTYVESSITVNLQGQTAGNDKVHTAGLVSELNVDSSYNPIAIHGEAVSRITVDDVVTREYKEVYYVPDEDGNYYEYIIYEGDKEWTKSLLSEEEIIALPIKAALIRDYPSLVSNLSMSSDIILIKDRENYLFEGEVDPKLLQDIFGINIYGSFMTNVEALLESNLNCALYIDKETSLPKKLELTFPDAFATSDMSFDSAFITVSYENYNKDDKIEVPNKVSFTALDKDANFYDTFYAWNLFLPYVNGESLVNGNGGQSASETFKSDWTSFQVRLDDGVTQLPLKYEDMKKLGYTIDSDYTQTLIEPNQYLDNIKLEKVNDYLVCTFYNDTTAAKPITECIIGAIDLSISNAPSNGIKLYLPGEVTLNMEKAALVAAYGEPDNTSTSFAADLLTWYGEDKENQLFEAEINASNGKIIRLHLRNIPVTGGSQTI